jgi:hypothetical protein
MSKLVDIPKKKYCATICRVFSQSFIILLLLPAMVNAQPDSAYAFIVAGHAYGAHSGGNIGLHPALLSCLNSGFDPGTAFFVFTGDIVNQSTTESWQQVEDELANYALPYYYVMGNHDANDIGRQVFEDKFGSTYYTFHSQSELFIVLNSTEEERSISSGQINFLEEQINLAGETIRNIFIFFHEILWNSNEKYIGVRSNSRSRYDQMVNYSNYWEDVHPLLSAKSDKTFFVIGGDVGGNPDAVAAFYDTWENVTLLASGMGEVADENYLLVHVYTADSIGTELIPLNSAISLPDITYYSVPPAPGAIMGPELVAPGSNTISYSVPEVFNADSYVWELPEGATGISTYNSIAIDFTLEFTVDTLSVKAAREGFGAGLPSSMIIHPDLNTIEYTDRNVGSLQIDFIETDEFLTVGIKGFKGEMLTIRLFDTSGRLLKSERIEAMGDCAEMQIDKNEYPKGSIILSASTRAQYIAKKIVIR